MSIPGVRLRPAAPSDLGYLGELARHPQVEPFLAPARGTEEHLEEMLDERTVAGDPFGLYVIEGIAGEAVGGLALALGSRNSLICNLRALMVDPAARRTGFGTAAITLACHTALVEHGFHRVQTESYGDNSAAHRLFERVGFVREGIRRQAYWRGDRWLDGVLYGMLAGELRDSGPLAG